MTDEYRHLEGATALPVPANRIDAISSFECADWLSFGTTTALALSIYLWTLAPNVTLEFSGMLSTGAMYAGVPHPPGYPLWTIYSWVFVNLLPFSNVAWRVGVGSATAGAVTCGLIALMVSHACGAVLPRDGDQSKRQRVPRIVCGYTAGMIFGFNGAFWDRVVVVDTWPLSILLLVATFALLMRWTYSPELRRYVYAAIFVYGLAVTNSQALLVAAPAFPVFVVFSDRKLGRDLIALGGMLFAAALFANVKGWLPLPSSYSELLDLFSARNLIVSIGTLAAVVTLVVKTRGLFTEWRAPVICLILFATALSAYLFVPIASMTNPPVNWGYPRTVEGFYHTLTRGQYEQIHPTENRVDFMKQLWMYIEVTGKEFGWVYVPFAILPFVAFPTLPRRERRWLLGTFAIFLCLAPVMIALLKPGLDGQSRELNKIFFSASYVILAVWVGLGCSIVGVAVMKSAQKASSRGI